MSPPMAEFSLSNALRLIRQPSLIPGALNRMCIKINQLYHKNHLPDGGNVMTEDWDNLLILDGCRYDLFCDVYDGDEMLEKHTSKGSDSWGFIESNFIGKEFHNTIYITANPFAANIPNGTFHAVINLLSKSWDENVKTVHPEDVVSETIACRDKYPNKRFIIHFMQPHYPFLGPTGKKLSHSGLGEFDEQGERIADAESEGPTSVWGQLEFRVADFNEQEVWQAYRENLEIVLPHAKRLTEILGGKSVITSDHGNLIGERTTPIPVQGYGHPRDLFVPELIEVPWLVIENERRSIQSDPPRNRESVAPDVVEDRLYHLGYS